ncbi:MAG: hypothetical protein MUE67_03610 [Anaerolineales bacterium]|nr:hypothetical protein [Anaerolineales bacterium]
MFRSLRLKAKPEINQPPPGALTLESLDRDAAAPVSLVQLNNLPDNTRCRIYRSLIPVELLARYGFDTLTGLDRDGRQGWYFESQPGNGTVRISLRCSENPDEDFFQLELSDNPYGGIDLNFIILNDPDSPRFRTDVDPQGRPNSFGTLRRNLSEELRAMEAGLAPGQIRSSLGASRAVFQQLEVFLSAMGQRALFLEPLSYASAWIFERRGFAYVRGHKLMEDIHREFQPGGRLYQALDGSSAFRQPGQAISVRGRAWAIHDGILETIDQRWDKLRMVKQIGRMAGVETFPGAIY